MAFDLSYLKPTKTTWITLFDVRIGSALDVQLELQSAVHDSSPFRREQRRLSEKMNKANTEEREAMMRSLWARTVIVGWRNVVGKDGQPVAYTASGENSGEELLAEIARSDLSDLLEKRITAAAFDVANFCDLPAPVDVGNG